MCLSTVYKIAPDGTKETVAKDVASVRYVDGKLVMYDIMGIPTEASGEIQRIDLMDNFIELK